MPVLSTWQETAQTGDAITHYITIRYRRGITADYIVDGLLRENDGRRVPVTLFTKGGGQWLEAMAETGCDALGLDWTTDIADARRRVGNKVALQGNMDPS